ncbi:MAG: hypothetical protein AABX33_08625 [Nanoarchaeota archaeon]
MNELVLAGLLGGVGGLTRGVVGLLKALALKRKILWSYWAIMELLGYYSNYCNDYWCIYGHSVQF